MSGVVVSPGLVVAPGVDGLNANSPIIGYQSLVNSGNVAATTAQPGAPASNLANPSTVLKWRASSAVADQVLTVTLETADDLDYVGIAGHNFGSGPDAGFGRGPDWQPAGVGRACSADAACRMTGR